MIKIINTILILSLLLSCGEKKRVEKEFHENGNLSLVKYLDSKHNIDSLFEYYSNGNKKVLLKLNKFDRYDYEYYDFAGDLKVSGEQIGVNGKPEYIGWVTFYKNDSILKEEALIIDDTLRINQRKLYVDNVQVIDSSTFYYYDERMLNLNIEKKYLYPAPGLCLAKELNYDFSNMNIEFDTIAPDFIDRKNNLFSWEISIDSLNQMNGFFVIYYWELQNDGIIDDSLRIVEFHKNMYIRGGDM